MQSLQKKSAVFPTKSKRPMDTRQTHKKSHPSTYSPRFQPSVYFAPDFIFSDNKIGIIWESVVIKYRERRGSYAQFASHGERYVRTICVNGCCSFVTVNEGTTIIVAPVYPQLVPLSMREQQGLFFLSDIDCIVLLSRKVHTAVLQIMVPRVKRLSLTVRFAKLSYEDKLFSVCQICKVVIKP